MGDITGRFALGWRIGFPDLSLGYSPPPHRPGVHFLSRLSILSQLTAYHRPKTTFHYLTELNFTYISQISTRIIELNYHVGLVLHDHRSWLHEYVSIYRLLYFLTLSFIKRSLYNLKNKAIVVVLLSVDCSIKSTQYQYCYHHLIQPQLQLQKTLYLMVVLWKLYLPFVILVIWLVIMGGAQML